ncbi:CDP-diacylglycerol diphosphatase [Cupriavidus campinensis]
MRRLRIVLLAVCLSISACADQGPWSPAAGGRPARNGLWRSVQTRCLTDGAPVHADCAVVDRGQGLVLYKDAVGASHYLVIPDHPVSGVEDPKVWAGSRPNGWAFGWRERGIVSAAIGKPVPDTLIGLAVNAKAARSQDQLHIHLDCIGEAAHRFLVESDIDGQWRPFRLSGKSVRARFIAADRPVLAFDPFDEVHHDVGAAGDIADRGVFVAYVSGPRDKSGFVIIDEPVDVAAGSNGHASDFLDRGCRLGRSGPSGGGR